jgi:ActR/RegA family two-component response regulator
VPSCEVVLMSGYASIDTAVDAVKLGAPDYLAKPFDVERLAALSRAVRERHERRVRVLPAETTLGR